MVRSKFANQDKIDCHNVKTMFREMGNLQNEIGFTQDDLFILCFTSLNEDYFTNLIVQAGEFTMWFNLNFEGESQEEKDFREARVHEWTSSVASA